MEMNGFARRQIGFLSAGALVVLLGALAGCAGLLTKDSPAEVKEQAARERSQARWALIIGKETGRAYEYLSKASRQVISRTDFVDRVSRTTFRSATVEKVDCSAELCQVNGALHLRSPDDEGCREYVAGNLDTRGWRLRLRLAVLIRRMLHGCHREAHGRFIKSFAGKSGLY